jgi:hypothetical protein
MAALAPACSVFENSMEVFLSDESVDDLVQKCAQVNIFNIRIEKSFDIETHGDAACEAICASNPTFLSFKVDVCSYEILKFIRRCLPEEGARINSLSLNFKSGGMLPLSYKELAVILATPSLRLFCFKFRRFTADTSFFDCFAGNKTNLTFLRLKFTYINFHALLNVAKLGFIPELSTLVLDKCLVSGVDLILIAEILNFCRIHTLQMLTSLWVYTVSDIYLEPLARILASPDLVRFDFPLSSDGKIEMFDSVVGPALRSNKKLEHLGVYIGYHFERRQQGYRQLESISNHLGKGNKLNGLEILPFPATIDMPFETSSAIEKAIYRGCPITFIPTHKREIKDAVRYMEKVRERECEVACLTHCWQSLQEGTAPYSLGSLPVELLRVVLEIALPSLPALKKLRRKRFMVREEEEDEDYLLNKQQRIQ